MTKEEGLEKNPIIILQIDGLLAHRLQELFFDYMLQELEHLFCNNQLLD